MNNNFTNWGQDLRLSSFSSEEGNSYQRSTDNFTDWGHDLRLSSGSNEEENYYQRSTDNFDTNKEDINDPGFTSTFQSNEGNYNNSGCTSNFQPSEENYNYPDFTRNFQTNLVFHSREELIKYVQDTAKSLGFVIKIGSSNKFNPFAKPRLYLDCDKSGPYDPIKPSSKNTGTKKCECRFRIKGHKKENFWKIEVAHGMHNHPVMNYMEGNALTGRLTEREMEIVKIMSANNVKARHILAAIKKKNPENKSTIKTIHNARAKLKVLEIASRTQVQQLLYLLESKSYIWNLRSDEESDELQDIFFIHPRSIDMFKAFPYVLFMDCTYRTNRFNLPLFEIVGVTSTENTFSVAFVLMQSEKKDNYIWALDCLRRTLAGCQLPRVILTVRDLALMHAVSVIFPNSNALLCTWHISKNVRDKGLKILGAALIEDFCDKWRCIVESTSLEEYQTNMQSMGSTYKKYPEALKYIGELLDAYKVKFVAYWTNQSMHYGNRTTNRAEAQHSRLKKYLKNSQGNLASVFDYIDQMLNAEATEIKKSLERSRNYVQHAYTGLLFKLLRGHVATPALKYILEECNRCNYVAFNGIEYCGCQLRISHGLPCAHELHVFINRGISIPLDYIDAYWRKLDFLPMSSVEEGLDCIHDVDKYISIFQNKAPVNQAYMLRKLRETFDPATTPIVEPRKKQQGRGRPSAKSKPDTSTRRQPSAWEYTERQAASRHSFHTSEAPRGRRRAQEKKRQSFNTSDQTHNPFQRAGSFGYDNQQTNSLGYITQFPNFMHRYISEVNDVISDGHCGFRAIAKSLNLLYGEESWVAVRRDLLNELTEHPYLYTEMVGGANNYNELCKTLSFFENIGCLQENRFNVLDMGHLVASRYNVAFVVLSPVQCQTFLPLRTGPPRHPQVICIGHVNDNHFVQILLSNLSPMPPINIQWEYNKQEHAEYWASVFQQKFQIYLNLELVHR